jgi:hypothetical protein
MMRGYILLLPGLLLAVNVFAQRDSTEAEAKRTTLTLAAIYGNNANYYGQTAEEKLPYILTNASLRLKSGFYFSAGSYKLINAGGSAISELDLSAGFEANLAKNFSTAVGYSRSIFAKNSPLLGAANENTLSASLVYDMNFIKTGLNSYYAFGTQRDLFISFIASKALNLGSLFSEKDFISFEPGFELVGGTLHYLEEYIVRRDRFGNMIPFDPSPKNFREQNYKITRNASSFDMISYNMNFLLGYNRNNYLIETGWQVSTLGKNVSETKQKPRSFFNLSLYYQF